MEEQLRGIAGVLERVPALDGGLTWDGDARSVVVRLVGAVDGASAEVERVKAAVLAVAEGVTVEFESVRYSRVELEQLVDELFQNPDLAGVGGGWDCSANRVLVVVPLGNDDTETLLERVRALDDDRILLRTFTPAHPRWETQATASPDLAVVRQWVERNPEAHARLTETVEHGGDRVVLVVSIPAHEEMVRARSEILPLVRFPELLRFRRWQPSEQETEWTLQWVLGLMRRQEELGLPTHVTSTWPDSESGLIMITLDRVDPAYAAELEARGNGLTVVRPTPENSVSLAVGRAWSHEDRVPAAESPTWVTVEKAQV
ncbi:hypothetical protein [Kribbella sp. CA-294648]|uniref:hypothetical protein n=1 Tax=Kribbella sp. CA-294648 TaxID=3239948 RepID=UPI003D8E57D0